MQIHDKGYKKLFSNKTIFRELIETFIDEKWVKDLDFDNCDVLDKSFISSHYKETENDIIYKLRLKGKEVYIFILIEFQSTVEHFMVLRLLNYITNFYMDYVESNKNIKVLPPIFPILLYNGDRKWTAPTNIADIIKDNKLFGRYSINFEYFKLAENTYGKDELLKIKNIVSTLFLAEAHYDIEMLKNEFLTIFENEKDKQAVSLFLNWLKQLSVHDRIDESDYQSIEYIYKNVEEVRSMLITSLEKERKELFNKGVEKGVEKGVKKGYNNGKLDEAKKIAKNFLNTVDIEIISKNTGLSVAEIKKLQ